MRIAVMGTGAVGGYFGAKLAAAGHELAFIARGRHLQALRENGLRVTSENGNLQIDKAQFTNDTATIGNVDAILFCVKSYDTEVAAEQIKQLVSDQTLILSLQNGVDNPDKLAGVFDSGQILPAVVYVGAQLSAPGLVTHANGGRIIFGQIDGGISESSKSLRQILSNAGIPLRSALIFRKFNGPNCCGTHPFAPSAVWPTPTSNRLSSLSL